MQQDASGSTPLYASDGLCDGGIGRVAGRACLWESISKCMKRAHVVGYGSHDIKWWS